jgi:hypothetical protein
MHRGQHVGEGSEVLGYHKILPDITKKWSYVCVVHTCLVFFSLNIYELLCSYEGSSLDSLIVAFENMEVGPSGKGMSPSFGMLTRRPGVKLRRKDSSAQEGCVQFRHATIVDHHDEGYSSPRFFLKKIKNQTAAIPLFFISSHLSEPHRSMRTLSKY